MSDRRAVVGSISALAVVLAVLFHASLFLGRGLVPADGVLSELPWRNSFQVQPSNYLLVDQYAAFVPVRQFFADEARAGRFPLWNPHLASGIPSLASMQGAALYPIHLLLSPIGPFVASGIAAFLKLFVAGLFMILYLRRLGASPPAALASGLVYSLSGFLIVWLGHPHVNSAVLLPALMLCVEVQLDEPARWRGWVGFACAYAATWLGGHPPTALHISFVVAIYFLFRLLAPGRPRRLRSIGSFVAATAAGLAMAAPQLLPFLEYYRESSIALSTGTLDRSGNHLAPATLVHFLLPFVTGAPHLGFEDLAGRLGLGDIDNFNERTGYVGVFTLFLVLVGVARARTRVAFFHAGLALAALLVVFGVPPTASIIHAIPIANGINHQRLLLFVGFSAATLAGFGLDALLGAARDRRPRVLALAFAASMVALIAGLWWAFGPAFSQLDDASRAFVLRHGWVFAGGVVLAPLLALSGWSKRVIAGAALGWIALDLLWFAWDYNPSIPRDLYYPKTEAIRTLQSDPSTFRILGEGTVLPPNTAAVFGLDDARGYDFTTLRRYEELITGQAGDFFFYRAADRLPASLPALGVQYVLVPERVPEPPDGFELAFDGEIAIYRYTRAADRALIVFDHEVEPAATILARMRSGAFDPSKTLLLEAPPPAAVQSGVDPSVDAAEARIVRYEPDRVVIDAKLPRPGFLLLLDNYYPGWRAFADGRELPIERADYTFRAVALPAGSTTVEFRYRPLSFRAGVVLSLGTLSLAMVLWAKQARARPRPAQGSNATICVKRYTK